MGALDDAHLATALRRYVIARGGDPDAPTLDGVDAEHEIERAIDDYVDREIDGQATIVCDGCGEEIIA